MILLSSFVFLNTTGEGLSVLDVLTGVFYIGSLSLWFFRAKFIYKKSIVKNFGDMLILIFFTLVAIFWIPLSIVSGAELLNVLREFLMFSLILLYFPFRDEFRTRDDLNELLVVTAVSIIAVTSFSLFLSYKNLTSAEFVHEIASGRRGSQFLGGVSIIFSAILFYLHPSKLAKTLIISVLFLSLVALIISLSRIYWFSTIVGFGMATVFLPSSQKYKIYITTFAVFASIILSVVLYFGQSSELILGYFQKRFTSTQSYKKDISLMARVQEYEAVWEHIKRFPLGGSGMSKEYSYYNLITQTNWQSSFVHNGYISFVYRFGFPMALMFYLFLIYYFWKSVSLAIWNGDNYSKALSACVAASFGLVFITSLLTTSVMFRDFYIYFPLLITVLSISENLKKNATQN